MKKYILTPVTQKNHVFYSMVTDPRKIVTAIKRRKISVLGARKRCLKSLNMSWDV